MTAEAALAVVSESCCFAAERAGERSGQQETSVQAAVEQQAEEKGSVRRQEVQAPDRRQGLGTLFAHASERKGKKVGLVCV